MCLRSSRRSPKNLAEAGQRVKTPKYQPLADYLNAVRGEEVTLSFAEIEALVGSLPKSAYEGTFWSNGRPLPFRPIRLIQQQTGFASYFQSTALKVRFKRQKR